MWYQRELQLMTLWDRETYCQSLTHHGGITRIFEIVRISTQSHNANTSRMEPAQYGVHLNPVGTCILRGVGAGGPGRGNALPTFVVLGAEPPPPPTFH